MRYSGVRSCAARLRRRLLGLLPHRIRAPGPAMRELGSPRPPHPRDIPAAALSRAMEAVARPDLLHKLVGIARRTFGFFPNHHHHVIAYPWVARWLEEAPPLARILDIGAGLSGLPIFFAEAGAIVDCIDPHPVVRVPPFSADWNEWGFFDYGCLHPNLAAHHRAVAEFMPPHQYRFIYSAAVLAHLSALDRRNALRRCRDLMEGGAMLLMTLDLVPGTDLLWNRREGAEIESAERHGSVGELSRELADLDFHIEELRVHRIVPQSRTDLLFLRCVRQS